MPAATERSLDSAAVIVIIHIVVRFADGGGTWSETEQHATRVEVAGDESHVVIAGGQSGERVEPATRCRRGSKRNVLRVHELDGHPVDSSVARVERAAIIEVVIDQVAQR